MEDIKVKIIAESQVDNAKVDLGELLTITKGLIEATNQLNITNQRNAAESKKGSTEQIGLINKLQSEIQTLTRLRNEADSVSKIESYNSKIREQQGELTKLTTAQARSNVLTKEQSDKLDSLTNTTKKTSSAFSNMAVTLGAFFAVDRFIDMAKGAFNLAITTDSLDVALKNVSASTKEYNQSIAFLNDITNRYGQQLVNLEGQYTQFIASSKSSNLTLIERNKIFESVIAAGSSLKLSNDKIEASLRAVSQMFSKGNVAAEELRGQLGEALPGAFGIMAKAMGVSETGLNKLLEQGKVLAADVLPKFADELNNLYGATAQNNVNTWTGASNRAYNSMTAWIVKQNESLGISDKLAKMANYVADNFEKIVNVVKSATVVFALYTANKIRSNIVDQVKLINLGREILAKQATTATTIELTVAENAAAAAATRFNAALAASPWGLLMVAGVAAITMLLNYKDAQENLIEAQGKLNKLVADALPDLVLEKNEFNSLAKSVLDTNLQKDERIKKLNILKDKFPEQLKGINNLSDAESNLGKVIRLTNQDFVTRAKLLENEVKIKYNNEIATKAIREQILLENQLANASTNKTYVVTGTAGYVQAYDSESEKIQKLIEKKKQLVVSTQKANEDLATYSEKLTKTVNYNLDSQTKKIVDKEEGQTKKEKAEQEKREKALAKSLLKNEKEIEKHYENQLKIADKAFKAYLKAIKGADEDELKAKKELSEQLKKQLESQFTYLETSNKLKEIRTAKSLDEIERIEEKYAKRAYNKLVEDVKDKLLVKENEFARLKKAGLMDVEETAKRSSEISKLQEELNDLLAKGNEKRIIDIKDGLNKKDKLVKEEREKDIEQEKQYQDLLSQVKKAAIDNTFYLLTSMYDRQDAMIDRRIRNTNDKVEKAALEIEKIENKIGRSVIGLMASMASGDVAGTVMGVVDVAKSVIDSFNSSTLIMIAKLEVMYDKLKAYADELNGIADPIRDLYGDLAEKDLWDTNNSDDLRQKIEVMLSLLKTYGNQSESEELKLGQMILTRYNLEIENATTKRDLALKNAQTIFDTDSKLENERFETAKNNINKEYELSIANINSKYEYESILAGQKYSADSIAIQENLNKGLLSFINNEESKTSIIADYAARRSEIQNIYALADKQITEGMSQADIDAINAAIEARDKQLSKLESWYTAELTFIVESEGQKRKEYSETERLKQIAADEQNTLDMKYSVESIERQKQKDVLILEADLLLKTNLQNAELTHKQLLYNIESQFNRDKLALETEFNDTILALGIEKDKQLSDSFNRLKDTFNLGYDEMIAKAKLLYEQGIITSEQMLSLIETANKLRYILNNGGEAPANTNTPNNPGIYIEPIRLPGFHNGTEFVQGEKGYDKILAKIEYGEGVINAPLNAKKIKAGLTNESAINYAINYKSLLQDMPNLTIKSSIAGKIEERNAMQYLLNMNVSPVVDKLDSLERTLSKLPIQTFNLDENGLTRYEQKGNAITIFKSKRLK